MKKRIKFITTIAILLCTFLLTGCTTDTMDGITISTSNYTLEYLTSSLYNEHATITKLYPDDVNIYEYKITNKLIKDVSKNNLFIYNGLTNDNDIAKSLLKKNNKIKIIDGTFGMSNTYGYKGIWLDPSNILMVAQNIKNGLKEYVSNTKLSEEIDANYENLKIKLSELDAEVKLISENSTYKNLVVANDELKFLEKYGFKIYSIANDNEITDKIKYDVEYLIESKQVDYIIALNNTKDNETIKYLKDKYNIEVLYLNDLTNITEENRKNEVDLITLFQENLDNIKKETYE
ncbi:MAG: metal ABC transporter substrate-binding protein [Bacilli bacterium]